MLGTNGEGGLWDRAARSAYLESDSPYGAPFTGRQFTNDEVFRNGFAQYELRHGEEFALGIHHYVLMRYDSARTQLATAAPGGSERVERRDVPRSARAACRGGDEHAHGGGGGATTGSPPRCGCWRRPRSPT